jgi:hypothetical protein
MARSAIAAVVCARLAHNYGPAADAGAAIQIQRDLEAALGAAAAAEREACALLAEGMENETGTLLAGMIRNRKS